MYCHRKRADLNLKIGLVSVGFNALEGSVCNTVITIFDE
jgi:hypothetical protein